MQNLSVKALDIDTWKDFEQLAQKHNGVWGGCGCTAFHPKSPLPKISQESTKSCNRMLVKEGRVHAVLVYDGDTCVSWCQFGSPQELPNIYHKKEVESMMPLPDWLITCIFIDRDYCKKGLFSIALNGALEFIKNAGGGVFKSYPQNVQGNIVSNSFLYNGTRDVFEKAGFTCEGTNANNHCIMRKVS